MLRVCHVIKNSANSFILKHDFFYCFIAHKKRKTETEITIIILTTPASITRCYEANKIVIEIT